MVENDKNFVHVDSLHTAAGSGGIPAVKRVTEQQKNAIEQQVIKMFALYGITLSDLESMFFTDYLLEENEIKRAIVIEELAKSFSVSAIIDRFEQLKKIAI